MGDGISYSFESIRKRGKAMKTTPFRMTPDVIRNEVIKGVPGAYILGDMEDGEFKFKYVGRSDSCLQTRLLTHDYLYEYSYFVFAYTADAKKAFELESKWWHDCHNNNITLRNQIHPDSPSNQLLCCPYCQFSYSLKHSVENLIAS